MCLHIHHCLTQGGGVPGFAVRSGPDKKSLDPSRMSRQISIYVH